MSSPTKPILGLVGGIGSGKSRVAESLARYGGFILVGDAFGHEALRQPEIKEMVRRRWGGAVLDGQGEIVRRQLGRIVFASAEERKALEQMTFPYIEGRILEEAAKAQADPSARFLVLDAAVMLEAGWNNFCDWIVYVHTPRKQRLKRLQEQRGWTEEEYRARATAQMPLTDKATRADFVIDNSGTPEDLDCQVADLLLRLGERGLEVSTRPADCCPDP